MLSLIPLLLSLLVPLIYAASAQGLVSLWTDTSCGNGATTDDVKRDPPALNYTLSVDVCGIPGITYRSFAIYQRPTCANGALAISAFYMSAVCQNDGFGFGPIVSIDGVPDHYRIGDCLNEEDFNSLAFLCAGLGEGASSSLTNIFYSSATKAATSSIASSASATPVVPSASMTSPLYTVPAASSLSGSVPINTASSGIAPSAGSPTSPFTPGFTGAGPRLGGSVAGVFVVLGGAILL